MREKGIDNTIKTKIIIAVGRPESNVFRCPETLDELLQMDLLYWCKCEKDKGERSGWEMMSELRRFEDIEEEIVFKIKCKNKTIEEE